MRGISLLFSLLWLSTLQTQKASLTAIKTLLNEINTEAAISVQITGADKIYFTAHKGKANIEHQIDADERTVYHGGFLSQQFTAYAILLLSQQGLLSLDDPVKKHLPEFTQLPTTLKIFHLAEHSAGLQDYWSLKTIAGWKIQDFFDKKTGLSFLKTQRQLTHKPGEQQYYNLSGYLLLAEIIERVSGETLASFTQENIFNPLGMANTRFIDRAGARLPHAASYYAKDIHFWRTNQFNYHDDNGPVGISITATDFSIWQRHLMKLHHDANTDFSPLFLTRKNDAHYTFGLERDVLGKYSLFFSSGFYGGYRSYAGIIPDQNWGLSIFSNAVNFDARALAQRLWAILLEQNEKPEENVQTIRLEPHQLKQFTGAYWDGKEYHAKRVFIENDTLKIHDEDYDFEYAILPLTENSFIIDGRHADIRISFEGQKNTLSMRYQRRKEVLSTYQRYEKSEPNQTNLATYCGTFYCEQLRTIYRIEVVENDLVAQPLRGEQFTLRPLVKDQFVTGQWYMSLLKFTQQNGNITGFEVESPEIKHLYFKKIELER